MRSTCVEQRTHLVRLGCALLVAAAGCGGPTIDALPADTLRAYASAVRDDRLQDAYSLLSVEAKRELSYDAFSSAVRRDRLEALQTVEKLLRPAASSSVRATLQLESGDTVEFVLESGRWRVGAGAVDSYPRRTPREALTTFLRALERKRYDVLLGLVPDTEREGPIGQGSPPALTVEGLRAAWEGEQRAEVQAAAAAIRAALGTAKVEESGDVASMAYGAGATVSFVREHGHWRIRSF